MISPEILAKAIIDDGSSYFRFTLSGVIGKYDPKTYGHYRLNEHGTWKRDGTIMRWHIDAAYDYEEIDPASINQVQETGDN